MRTPKSTLAKKYGNNTGWLNLITLILLISLILLPRILPFPRSFLTYDELKIGVQISQMTQALFVGDWPGTANSPYPAVTLAWLEAIQVGLAQLVPGLSPALLQFPADIDHYAFAALPRWRLTLAVFNTLIILILFWLLQRLYDKFVAITAVILMALDPFLLTESRTFRTEGLTTGLMMLSAVTVIFYAKKRERRWLVVSGILAGLATLTRISAVFMFPFAGLVLLTWPILSGRAKIGPLLKQTTVDVFLWSLMMGGTFLVLWPALWSDPLNALNTLQEYLRPAVVEANRVWKKGVFFQGRRLADVDPGLQFYAWALAYRTTPLIGAGLLAAVVSGLATLVEKVKQIRVERRSALSILAVISSPTGPLFSARQITTLLILAFIIFYVIGLNLTVIKIDRYLVAVFPALAILAAVGFQAVAERLSSLTKQKMMVQGSVWAVVLLAGAGLSLPHHPYYYTYWNPLLGGGKTAVEALPAMGRQGTDVLVDYLNALPNAKDIRLAGTGLDLDFVQECPQVFSGTCLWYPDFLKSDYFLMSIYSAQNDIHLANIKMVIPDVEVVQQYDQAGVTYAWLYKMPEDLQFVGHFLDRYAGSFSGYRLTTTELAAGDSLEATLFWQNGEKSGWQFDDSELYLKVLDPSGHLQQIAPARLKPGFETYLSQPNDILAFSARLDFPPDTALGHYTLEIGLRLTATAEETIKFPLANVTKTITVNRGTTQSLDGQLQFEQPLGQTGLSLVGYDFLPLEALIEAETSAGAQRLPRLDLYWRADQILSEEYALRLTLIDPQGKSVVVWRNKLAPDIHPLTAWQPGRLLTYPYLSN